MNKSDGHSLTVSLFFSFFPVFIAVCTLLPVCAHAAVPASALPAGSAAYQHGQTVPEGAQFRDGSPSGLPGRVLSEGHLLMVGEWIMYQHSSGEYAYSEWKKYKGKTYYFNKYGYAMTGLQYIGGRTYYFNSDGEQQTKNQYVNGKLIRFNKDGSVLSVGDRYYTAPRSSKGMQVVNYAKRFLGNPYRWGGSSLTHGADCSGFVMAVYAHFGIRLPHYDAAIRKCGRSVGSLAMAAAGDVICYDGHVAIYMGDGRIIHAADEKHGICIGDNPAFMRILSIRRFF